MAVSILVAAQTLQPVYNPNIWVFNSTANTQTNFQYIFDVWDMTAVERISRVKMPANPDGYGIYDAHKVLETITTHYVPEPVQGFYAINNKPINNISQYQIRAGEEYEYHWDFHQVISGSSASITYLVNSANTTSYYSAGDVISITQNTSVSSSNPQLDGLYTVITGFTAFGTYIVSIETPITPTITQYISGDTTWSDLRSYQFMTYSSDTKFVFNGADKFNDFIDWSWSDYSINTTYQGKFLSTVPNNWKFQLESIAYLNFWSSSLVGDSKWMVIQRDDGTKFKFDNSFPSCQWAIVSVGPANLNAQTLSFGSQPVITSTTTRYSAWTESTLSARTSEVKVFDMDTQCRNNKYTSYQLVWMDRKGSWISHTFDLASKRRVEIKKKKYKSLIGSYNASTLAWNYAEYDRGSTTMNVDLTEEVTVTSNWMTESNANFLEELFSSPLAYHYTGGEWLAIDLTESSFENKYRNTNKLINYTVKFEYSNPNEVQRG